MAKKGHSRNRRSAALVTGASRGIGLAVARELGRLSDEVVLVARSTDALTTVASDLRQRGVQVQVAPTDLADDAQIRGLARFVEDTVGHLDILVHAAGIYEKGLLGDSGGDDPMLVNYRGAAQLTICLLPLLEVSRGQIVFINSTQGLSASRNIGAYAASKFALRAFADSLRAEVNERGIRVLNVFAGSTATAMQERIHEGNGRPYRPDRLIQSADVAVLIASCLRLPRTAEVTELTVRPMLPPSH
jgi:short-subunit dehydrogenase